MWRRLTDEEAVSVMRKAGFEPLEPYPGAGVPWRCVHDVETCGREVTPCYSSIQQGRKGCRFCGGGAVDPEDAMAIMRAADFEPLEPYPGSSKPWRCVHDIETCGREVTPTYNKIQQGRKGCRFCGGGAVDPEDAMATMLSAGLKPMEPYPGSKVRWRCIHLRCKREVTRFYYSIKRGGSGCQSCFHQDQFIEPKDAKAAMLSAELEPLEPYPGSDKRWRCLCLRCKREVLPLYTSIQQGHRGCKSCADQDRRIDHEEAKAIMLNAGLKPLEPYPGTLSQWRCLCLTCGREVRPRRADIQQGGGGCSSCAEYGFNPSKPGWLYLIESVERDMLQVGITNDLKRRLKEHARGRFDLVIEVTSYKIGQSAKDWESKILKYLRDHGAVMAPDAGLEKFDGYTESWLRESFPVRSLKQLRALVLDEEAAA